LGCTAEGNVSELVQSKMTRQAEDILGESHQDVTPSNLPSPHPSPMGDPPPPDSSTIPPRVDCRVSDGSSFVQLPTTQGTSPSKIVSHQVLVPWGGFNSGWLDCQPFLRLLLLFLPPRPPRPCLTNRPAAPPRPRSMIAKH
jgi:hypothetical protein